MTLELEYESSGRRHYLTGRPVHCGAVLEVKLGGQWVPCRYEIAGEFTVVLHTIGGTISPNGEAEFRWPQR